MKVTIFVLSNPMISTGDAIEGEMTGLRALQPADTKALSRTPSESIMRMGLKVQKKQFLCFLTLVIDKGA